MFYPNNKMPAEQRYQFYKDPPPTPLNTSIIEYPELWEQLFNDETYDNNNNNDNNNSSNNDCNESKNNVISDFDDDIDIDMQNNSNNLNDNINNNNSNNNSNNNDNNNDLNMNNSQIGATPYGVEWEYELTGVLLKSVDDRLIPF